MAISEDTKRIVAAIDNLADKIEQVLHPPARAPFTVSDRTETALPDREFVVFASGGGVVSIGREFVPVLIRRVGL